MTEKDAQIATLRDEARKLAEMVSDSTDPTISDADWLKKWAEPETPHQDWLLSDQANRVFAALSTTPDVSPAPKPPLGKVVLMHQAEDANGPCVYCGQLMKYWAAGVAQCPARGESTPDVSQMVRDHEAMERVRKMAPHTNICIHKLHQPYAIIDADHHATVLTTWCTDPALAILALRDDRAKGGTA